MAAVGGDLRLWGTCTASMDGPRMAVLGRLMPLSVIGRLYPTLSGQPALMGEWLESDLNLTFGTSSLALYAALPDLQWSHADHCLHRGSGGDRKDLPPT